MDDETAQVIGAIILIVILIALVKGAIKTFQRNWIVALILLIILTPIWIIWAFVELFTGEIKKDSTDPPAVNQNVHVTLVNQSDGTSRQVRNNQLDENTKVIDERLLQEEPSTMVPTQTPLLNETRDCPYCAETIKKNAIVCRYCNRDIGES